MIAFEHKATANVPMPTRRTLTDRALRPSVKVAGGALIVLDALLHVMVEFWAVHEVKVWTPKNTPRVGALPWSIIWSRPAAKVAFLRRN